MKQALLIAMLFAVGSALHPIPASAQTNAVTPVQAVSIGVTMASGQSLNATDDPVSIPLSAGTDMTLFRVGNVVKIDNEYFLVTDIVPATSRLTASRAQLGSSKAVHTNSPQAQVQRVYQMEVQITSATAIGAYQLKVNFPGSNLALAAANVFPGNAGPLSTPVAVNTSNSDFLILNSFNASASAPAGTATVARLYFTGKAAGTAGGISVEFMDVADAAGADLGATPAGSSTTLSTNSLTVLLLDAVKRRVQITSQ